MSEPRTAFQKAPLKKEAEEQEEPERRSAFETLVPASGRPHLFKRPKGRIGMG